VLKLIGEGYQTKKIAQYLLISPKTVEKHRSNITKKLDIHTASRLTVYAIEKGLTPQARARLKGWRAQRQGTSKPENDNLTPTPYQPSSISFMGRHHFTSAMALKRRSFGVHA
jgi:hypothetical protein